MLCVVAYDIAESGRRERVARVLLGYGRRVQHSVFEVDIEPGDLSVLLERLRPWLDEASDGLRVYRLCGSCAPLVEVVCGPPVWVDPGFYLV
jgi:CRISPR-associated protein Cas2